jgi:hypothetical protein
MHAGSLVLHKLVALASDTEAVGLGIVFSSLRCPMASGIRPLWVSKIICCGAAGAAFVSGIGCGVIFGFHEPNPV